LKHITALPVGGAIADERFIVDFVGARLLPKVIEIKTASTKGVPPLLLELGEKLLDKPVNRWQSFTLVNLNLIGADRDKSARVAIEFNAAAVGVRWELAVDLRSAISNGSDNTKPIARNVTSL
jgi:hypothetical protein